MEGMGPEPAIELRTEDGGMFDPEFTNIEFENIIITFCLVSLQPQDFTIREVSSTEVDITWR